EPDRSGRGCGGGSESGGPSGGGRPCEIGGARSRSGAVARVPSGCGAGRASPDRVRCSQRGGRTVGSRRPGRGGTAGGRPHQTGEAPRCGIPGNDLFGGGAGTSGEDASQDRKSTRLNSSHVKI